MSLYDALGQEQGIRTAVDMFYDRVLGDVRLQHYFQDVDLRKLRQHQAALLVTVAGGPSLYEGRDLGAAHDRLAITPEHFDVVVGHLGATLDDLGVDPAVRDQVAGALGTHRDEIVSSSPAGV